MPPSGGVSGTSGWNHRRGEILQWSSELSFMRNIIFTGLQLYRLCNKDRDDRSAYTSGLITQHKIPNQWCRFLFCLHSGTCFLGSVSSMGFQLWLCTHNPFLQLMALIISSHAGSCQCVTSGWVETVTWLRGWRGRHCTVRRYSVKWNATLMPNDVSLTCHYSRSGA